jgi:hypothetical protein
MNHLTKKVTMILSVILAFNSGHSQNGGATITTNAAPAQTAAATAEDPNWEKQDGMYAVFTTDKAKSFANLNFKRYQ